jgi:hypothetical protein
MDGGPILLVPGGYVHLTDKRVRGGSCRENYLYRGELTDEEAVLAMEWTLSGRRADNV